jgi:hypothetical protein
MGGVALVEKVDGRAGLLTDRQRRIANYQCHIRFNMKLYRVANA